MPPNATTTNECTGVLNEADAETIDGGLVKDITVLKKAEKRKLILVWRNIILFAYLHMAAVYGLYLMIFSAKWSTGFFGEFLFFFSQINFDPNFMFFSSNVFIHTFWIRNNSWST